MTGESKDFVMPPPGEIPAGAVSRLHAIVADAPFLLAILRRWDAVDLPDGWLSGSVLAQTAWNHAFNFPADHGVADIDLVYFDPSDLSEEAEEQHAARIRALLPDFPIRIDVKNEARVHLWYEAKFGYPIAPYRSVGHAISTFPTTAGSVAIRPDEQGVAIYAPFGLTDLFNCTVRPNKVQITQDIYEAKITRWRRCWPCLKIISWEDA